MTPYSLVYRLLGIPEELSVSIFEPECVDYLRRHSDTDAAGYSEILVIVHRDCKVLCPAAVLFNRWYWYCTIGGTRRIVCW